MERAQAPAFPAVPDIEAKDNPEGLLKSQNPDDLYYSNLHMECYYFYQQCKDHFKFARSLGHKQIPFAIRFLKDHMLN